MIKTRVWIIIIAAFAAVCTAFCALLMRSDSGSVTAKIYHNGELIRSIDLSEIREPIEFTVTDENGSNTVLAETGSICIISADCPDKNCVKMGQISGGAMPIVCLPHKLIIRIEGEYSDENAIDIAA